MKMWGSNCVDLTQVQYPMSVSELAVLDINPPGLFLESLSINYLKLFSYLFT
jgi:hypothetical protein